MGAFPSRFVRCVRCCWESTACCRCRRPSTADRADGPPTLPLREVKDECQKSGKDPSASDNVRTREASQSSALSEYGEVFSEAESQVTEKDCRTVVAKSDNLGRAEDVDASINLEECAEADKNCREGVFQSDSSERAEDGDASVNLEECTEADKDRRTEVVHSDNLGHANNVDACMNLAEAKSVHVALEEGCVTESGRRRLEDELIALEESLDATERMPSAIQDVLSNARRLLKCVRNQKAAQDEPFTEDELIISLNKSLENLEKLLDCVEARPANVLAVIGAAKELLTAIKTGH